MPRRALASLSYLFRSSRKSTKRMRIYFRNATTMTPSVHIQIQIEDDNVYGVRNTKEWNECRIGKKRREWFVRKMHHKRNDPPGVRQKRLTPNTAKSFWIENVLVAGHLPLPCHT